MSDRSGSGGSNSPAVTSGTVDGWWGLTKVAARFARNRLALAGLIVLGLFVLVTILEPVLVRGTSTHDPANDPNLSAILQGPSAAHPLGTDEIGRDELARVLQGVQTSMLFALVNLALATVIGAVVLAIGAMVAGKRYSTLARVFEVVSTPVLIFVLIAGAGILVQEPPPQLPLLTIFGVAIREWATPSNWGNDLTNAALLLSLFLVGEVVRFGYLLFRSLRSGQARAAVSSLTPGKVPVLLILGPAVVTGLWIAGDAILDQNVLAFYGIGTFPPRDPLSLMIGDASNLRSTSPQLFFAPLILLLLMVLSLNVVGFGLRSALRGLADQHSAR
jgi:peptide/nickel transport system permease protein